MTKKRTTKADRIKTIAGIIVSKFKTLAGKTRYVVECTVEGAGGMLHIYNETQLKRAE